MKDIILETFFEEEFLDTYARKKVSEKRNEVSCAVSLCIQYCAGRYRVWLKN